MQDENTPLAFFRMAIASLGAWIANLTLNQVITVVTLLYVVLQIGLLIIKYYGLYKRWRAGLPLSSDDR